ncbi:MAG: homoserine kinase [Polyangia bacterium]
MKRATAFAPASIGNLAVGFDLLGGAIDGIGDRATVERNESGTVTITSITGVVTDLPLDPAANTAGRALLGLCELRPGIGFQLSLDKGIALGSGMGGSAASAVAALLAANATLSVPVSPMELYDLALLGEAVASGSVHGDNVAPSLLGGIVLAPSSGAPVRVPVPTLLWTAICHPHMVLSTREARAALKGEYALSSFVEQSEGLALVLAGCYTNDLSLIKRGLRDVLVEPRRASLIPGFADVKQAALAAGALGASISGAGPSLFAWFDGKQAAERGAQAMSDAFSTVGLASDRYVSPAAAPGARVE